MAEKTEKATPKKLRDARKKGQVAKSQDFPAAFTFIASFVATVWSAGYIYQQITGYMRTAFTGFNEAGIEIEQKLGGYIQDCLHVILNCSLPIMLIVVGVGTIVGFLVAGPVFSMEAMKPDLKRLNPVDNIKNMFKLKTLIELLKSIFKITGAVILIYTVVYGSLPDIIGTAGISVMGSAIVVSDFLIKVAIRVGIFFIIIAILDLAFQKYNFGKEMKMEKHEVKQEFRDTEGDPHMKSKRKQAAQEIAYQEGPSSVKRAKAVITNPTHIAVALAYDAEKDPAPKVLTMGVGIVADQIIKEAQKYHIPIMRNVPLTHLLYEKAKIGNFIPEETYKAVAEILRWIAALEEGEEPTGELFK